LPRIQISKHWIGICLAGLSLLGRDYERPRRILRNVELRLTDPDVEFEVSCVTRSGNYFGRRCRNHLDLLPGIPLEKEDWKIRFVDCYDYAGWFLP